jgi:hypothetical protein
MIWKEEAPDGGAGLRPEGETAIFALPSFCAGGRTKSHRNAAWTLSDVRKKK